MSHEYYKFNTNVPKNVFFLWKKETDFTLKPLRVVIRMHRPNDTILQSVNLDEIFMLRYFCLFHSVFTEYEYAEYTVESRKQELNGRNILQCTACIQRIHCEMNKNIVA